MAGPGTLRSWRRGSLHFAALFFALYAILLQALLPLAQTITVTGPDGVPRPLIICTAEGIRTLALSLVEASGAEDPTSQQGTHTAGGACPFCLSDHISLHFAPPAKATPGLRIPVIALGLGEETENLRDHRDGRSYFSRAPPFLGMA